MDLGELRARIVAEADQIKAELRDVKRDLKDMGSQARTVSDGFDDLNKSLSSIGLSADQIKKINNNIRQTNPQILERHLKEVEDQLRQLGVQSHQIEKIKQELKETSNEAKKTQQSFGSLESALTALGGAAAFHGITRAIGVTVNASDNMRRSFEGLVEVAKALNVDVDRAVGLAQQFVDDGLMTIADAANAVKVALSMEMTLEETEQLIRGMGDAAAYNRASHLTMSEAIVQGVQAIKMGNSELLDNTGLTRNLSNMQTEYAKKLGTSVEKLSDAEKFQAALNGVMADAALFSGNASRALEGYTGDINKYNIAIEELKAEIGEGFIPVITATLDIITPLVIQTAKFSEENQRIVVGIGITAAAFTGLTTVITGLAFAVNTLKIALGGPVGLLVTLGTLAVSMAIAHETMDLVGESTEETRKKTVELTREYDSLKASADRLKDGTDEAKKAHERMAEIMDELRKIAPDVVELYENEADGIDTSTEALRKNTEEQIRNLKAKLARERAELPSKHYGNHTSGAETAARNRINQLEKDIASLEHQVTRIDMTPANIADQGFFDDQSWLSGDHKKTYNPDDDDGGNGNRKGGKKPKTKAELEREAYQESLKYIQYRRDLNQMSEEQEVAALNRLLERYKHNAEIRKDLEVKIYQLKKQMTEEAKELDKKSAAEAFAHSTEWIENEERRMNEAGETEEAIAQMKFDAWTRVRNRYAEDTQFYKQADQQVYDNKRRLIDLGVQMQLEALNKTRDMQRDALEEANKEAEREMEKNIESTRKRYEKMVNNIRAEIEETRERYNSITEAIRKQIDAIDEEIRKQQELDRIEDRRMKRQELMDKREAIMSDRRFEKVVRGPDGQLTTELTYDTAAVADIDKQLREMDLEEEREQRRQALEERKEQLQEEITAINAKRDAEINALQLEIDAVNEAKEKKLAAMNEELEALKENNQKKLEAFDLYWETVLDKDKVAQDVRNQVMQTGLDQALENIQSHLNSVMASYQASIQSMMQMGSQLSGSIPIVPQTFNQTSSTDNRTQIGNVNVVADTIDKFLDSISRFRRISKG